MTHQQITVVLRKCWAHIKKEILWTVDIQFNRRGWIVWVFAICMMSLGIAMPVLSVTIPVAVFLAIFIKRGHDTASQAVEQRLENMVTSPAVSSVITNKERTLTALRYASHPHEELAANDMVDPRPISIIVEMEGDEYHAERKRLASQKKKVNETIQAFKDRPENADNGGKQLQIHRISQNVRSRALDLADKNNGEERAQKFLQRINDNERYFCFELKLSAKEWHEIENNVYLRLPTQVETGQVNLIWKLKMKELKWEDIMKISNY